MVDSERTQRGAEAANPPRRSGGKPKPVGQKPVGRSSRSSRKPAPSDPSAAAEDDGDGASGNDSSESSELSFETALSQLEQTVLRLEAGDLPLEEALELFEGGIELSRRCNATLDAAERRIEILMAERDGSGDGSGEGIWRPERFEAAPEDELAEDDPAAAAAGDSEDELGSDSEG